MGCKCAGAMVALAGILVLLNEWFAIVSLGILMGALLVVGGLVAMFMPQCTGEGCCMAAPKVAPAKPAVSPKAIKPVKAKKAA